MSAEPKPAASPHDAVSEMRPVYTRKRIHPTPCTLELPQIQCSSKEHSLIPNGLRPWLP